MRRSILAAIFLTAVLSGTSILRAQPRSIYAALRQPVPDAKLTNVPLGDALDFVRDVGGININVDWKSLEAINITRNTQVNIELHGVRLQKVLDLVLTEAAPGDLLTYYVDGNVLEITTEAVADAQMITVVYYVDDLITESMPFDPTIQANFGQSQVTGGSGGGGSGSGTSSIFSGGAASNGNQQTETKEQHAQDLIKMIETVIRPDIWRDNGGTGTATIEYYNGNLIVSAPRSVQEAIGGPIEQ